MAESKDQEVDPCRPFQPGQESGGEAMRREFDCVRKSFVDLFAVRLEAKVRVGPDLNPIDVNTVSLGHSAQIGGADLGGKAVRVGHVRITENGVIKVGAGYRSSEDLKRFGQVRVEVVAGVDAKEAAVQTTRLGAEAIVNSPAGNIVEGVRDKSRRALEEMGE